MKIFHRVLVPILLLLVAKGSFGVAAEPSVMPGIQGVWHIVFAEGAGISGSKNPQVEITDKMLVMRADNQVVMEAKYTLNPKRTPPAIDLDFKGQATLGIYELKGNALRLCLGPGKTRPTKFAGSEDTMFLVLERGQSEAAGTPDTDEPRSYGTSADNTGMISAPVTYKDTMLIAVTSEGVAAIVFGARVEHGTKYRFRFLKKGASREITGYGSVFERYVDGHYTGGRLTIRAGTIKIGWSDSGDDRGWIYYEPESMRVQIASAKRFEDKDEIRGDTTHHLEKLDLKRFLKQP